MKKTLIIASCLFFGITGHSLSEPQTDAVYIAQQHLISTNAERKLDALTQVVLKQLQPGIEAFGAKIVDPDLFMDELLGDFETELLSTVRRTSAVAYQELMTDEEIASLADFYRSNEGQAFLKQGLSEATLNDHIAFAKEGPGAPLMKHFPDLMAIVEDMNDEVTARLNELFSPDRFADIMEIEEIVSFEDEARRQAVVDVLRNGGKEAR